MCQCISTIFVVVPLLNVIMKFVSIYVSILILFESEVFCPPSCNCNCVCSTALFVLHVQL